MISSFACVADFARLGEGCVVHPFAVLGHLPSCSRALARKPVPVRDLSIGDRTEIGPHAVIYAGVTIGADCLVGDHASIREGSVIGDRCIVGRSVTVHYDVEIGDDVRLLDGTHVTGGCRIGAGSFIGPGVVTSNDRHVDLANYRYRGPEAPVIGRGVMIGSGANILAGVSIGDGAVIGAGALVVTDVAAGARILGQKATAR